MCYALVVSCLFSFCSGVLQQLFVSWFPALGLRCWLTWVCLTVVWFVDDYSDLELCCFVLRIRFDFMLVWYVICMVWCGCLCGIGYGVAIC